MKKFKIFWDEYLLGGNGKFVYEMEVLCRGDTYLYAKNEKQARTLWKRAFPKSYIIACVSHENPC